MPTCDKCNKVFTKGHKAWCSDCKKPHPICHNCYEEALKKGQIKKKNINITDLDPKRLDKWT